MKGRFINLFFKLIIKRWDKYDGDKILIFIIKCLGCRTFLTMMFLYLVKQIKEGLNIF